MTLPLPAMQSKLQTYRAPLARLVAVWGVPGVVGFVAFSHHIDWPRGVIPYTGPCTYFEGGFALAVDFEHFSDADT